MNKRVYKILLTLGISVYVIALIYTLVTVTLAGGVTTIFMVEFYGFMAYFEGYFITLLTIFPISLIALLLIFISCFKLFNKGKYVMTLLLGLLFLLFIVFNAASLDMKSLLYSIKDLWVIFIIGIILITFSIIKLIKAKDINKKV